MQAVRLLLDYVDRRQVYQALLAAINVGNEEIAETIIEHPKYDEIREEMSRHRGAASAFQTAQSAGGRSCFNDNNQFSEEITPLILASQQNRFEVLLNRVLCVSLNVGTENCNFPADRCRFSDRRYVHAHNCSFASNVLRNGRQFSFASTITNSPPILGKIF